MLSTVRVANCLCTRSRLIQTVWIRRQLACYQPSAVPAATPCMQLNYFCPGGSLLPSDSLHQEIEYESKKEKQCGAGEAATATSPLLEGKENTHARGPTEHQNLPAT